MSVNLAGRLRPTKLPAAIAACFCLALISKISAQEAIGPTAPTTEAPQSIVETASEPTPAPLNPVPEHEVSAEPRRFQYEFQVTARGIYDDNINITQTNKISDYYFTIEPVLTLGFGDITGHEDNFLRLDYAPSAFFFADHSENDAVQQLIHLEGQHQFARLTLTLAEEIALLDGTDLRSVSDATAPGSHPNLDVSGRTRFQTYNTRLGASYDLSGKTFLSSGVDSLITKYDSSNLFSSEIISGNIFINYRYSEKVVVGAGGTAGYDFVDDPNPQQTFEQANARVSYQATGKVFFNLSAGVEFRQFDNSSRGEYISPVFELSASYKPSDATTFTASGSRRTFNSGVLAGQDFAATTIGAALQQRLMQRFYFAVNAGYQNSDYFNTVSGIAANRQDNYYFIEPAVDFSITRFWSVGGYYLHRKNDSSSTAQSFSFSDNQMGFRTRLVF